MYTADDARRGNWHELDARIRHSVEGRPAGPKAAYLRIYHDDSFRFAIAYELERRGFKNIDVPDITLKGDVYFEWD